VSRRRAATAPSPDGTGGGSPAALVERAAASLVRHLDAPRDDCRALAQLLAMHWVVERFLCADGWTESDADAALRDSELELRLCSVPPTAMRAVLNELTVAFQSVRQLAKSNSPLPGTVRSMVAGEGQGVRAAGIKTRDCSRMAANRVNWRDANSEDATLAHPLVLLPDEFAAADDGAVVGPAILGALCESGAAGRAATGAYYTPRPVARLLVREALKCYLAAQAERGNAERLSERLVEAHDATGLAPATARRLLERLDGAALLDPCCGTGALLLAALEELLAIRRALAAAAGESPLSRADACRQIIARNLYGVELDPLAAEAARLRLWLAAVAGSGHVASHESPESPFAPRKQRCSPEPMAAFRFQIAVGDALLREPLLPPPAPQRFAMIVGNPPYVDAHTLVRTAPAYRKELKARYAAARGPWDLYVPFWQRCDELLTPDGATALLTPAKWLSTAYGRGLRQRLAGRVAAVLDFSRQRAFRQLGVAAVGVVVRADACRAIGVRQFDEDHRCTRAFTLPSKLTEHGGHWGLMLSAHGALLLRLIEANARLADFCDVEEAFSVGEAYRLRGLVHEAASDEDRAFRLLTTGAVDAFASRWGQRPTRYLGASLQRPVVERDELARQLPRRFAQAAAAKIVLAGIRHFEAFFDERAEHLAAISTIVLRNVRPPYTPWLLTGLLNSRVVRFFQQECFGSLSIDGGVNFSRDNVSQIPVPREPGPAAAALARCAHQLAAQAAAGANFGLKGTVPGVGPLRDECDRLVCEMFGATGRELAVILDCV
jgi:hypothetical protein